MSAGQLELIFYVRTSVGTAKTSMSLVCEIFVLKKPASSPAIFDQWSFYFGVDLTTCVKSSKACSSDCAQSLASLAKMSLSSSWTNKYRHI